MRHIAEILDFKGLIPPKIINEKRVVIIKRSAGDVYSFVLAQPHQNVDKLIDLLYRNYDIEVHNGILESKVFDKNLRKVLNFTSTRDLAFKPTNAKFIHNCINSDYINTFYIEQEGFIDVYVQQKSKGIIKIIVRHSNDADGFYAAKINNKNFSKHSLEHINELFTNFHLNRNKL